MTLKQKQEFQNKIEENSKHFLKVYMSRLEKEKTRIIIEDHNFNVQFGDSKKTFN